MSKNVQTVDTKETWSSATSYRETGISDNPTQAAQNLVSKALGDHFEESFSARLNHLCEQRLSSSGQNATTTFPNGTMDRTHDVAETIRKPIGNVSEALPDRGRMVSGEPLVRVKVKLVEANGKGHGTILPQDHPQPCINEKVLRNQFISRHEDQIVMKLFEIKERCEASALSKAQQELLLDRVLTEYSKGFDQLDTLSVDYVRETRKYLLEPEREFNKRDLSRLGKQLDQQAFEIVIHCQKMMEQAEGSSTI